MNSRLCATLLSLLAVTIGAAAGDAAADYGPDTCRVGYVWREACGPYDHVCVTAAVRTQAAQDNAQAANRRDPRGGPFGPDTCKQGFVWREACGPNDHVCVIPATRTRARVDNDAAAGRMQYTHSVRTERNNNARTGAYQVGGFNQALVGDRRWGLRGSLGVIGTVYAQPLFIQHLTVEARPGARDVIFVATAQNNVYAFDAAALGAPLWMRPLGANDRSKIGKEGCDGISGNEGIGIEATPVIDTARGRIYVSYRTLRGQSVQQRLAALELGSGRPVADVEVAPPGHPDEWPKWNRSRASLLLSNGVIYVAFASRCEDPGTPPFHGWLLAYDVDALRRVGSYTPAVSAQGITVDGAGIWQGSVGPAADEQGDLFFSTGNRRLGDCLGACDTASKDAPNFADSVVRLRPERAPSSAAPGYQLGLQVSDWFAPYRKIWLDAVDLDLAASGPVLIPGTSCLVAAGKQGVLYVLDRDHMGQFDTGLGWSSATLDQIFKREDHIYADWPDDPRADHVVQKFQAGINQYLPEGSPYLTRPGAPVAVTRQSDNVLSAFVVGRDGGIWVTFKANGQWSDVTSGRPPPARISPANLAPAGAPVAVARQNNNQLDAFVVGHDGAVYVTWEVGDGRWRDGAPGWEPARISPAHLAPPGACVNAAKQNDQQLDAFVVGNDGAVWVTWEVADGRWRDGAPGWEPARISPVNFAPPGSCVAVAKQNDHQLDAFIVGYDGAIHVTWEVDDGRWRDGAPGWEPARISPVNLTRPGARVAAIKQNDHQLDAFVVANDGAVWVTWEVDDGRWRDGAPGWEPARISPANFSTPGTSVVAVKQNDHQLDALFVDKHGTVWVTWEVDDGRWRDGAPGWEPAPATPPGVTSSEAWIAAAKEADSQLDAFYVANNGALWVTSEVNDGHWSDASAANIPGPTILSRALWMNNWFDWPHVHGAPVFAKFPRGPSILYVWPEKDHLKGFRWLGNRFDADNRILASDQQGLLLAPPGPPFGMPGGMLAAVVDPGSANGGVVFASIARVPDQSKGMLRALDPLTLREIWNNGNEDYPFAKFVPPTIAGTQVLLPTAIFPGTASAECGSTASAEVGVLPIRDQ